MKLTCNLGDPLGACADGEALLQVVECAQVTALGPRTYRLRWTWTGCRSFLPLPLADNFLGCLPCWYKVYVNGVLRATQELTETDYVYTAADDEDPWFAVVVVGPNNGDPEYDPDVSLAAIPGNRVRIDWTPPSNSDLDHFHVYWDSGTGSVSYTTPLAEVRADGSATYSWTSTPLANGTYKFVVRSVDTAGNTETNTTTATVTIAALPAAPTGLAYSYSAATKMVTLTFTSSATVNVYSNGGSGDIDYTSAVATGQSSPWTSGVLTGPGTFRYAVRAETGAGEEKNLAYVEFEIDAAEAEVNRPLSPYGLSATAASGGTFAIAGWIDLRQPVVYGRTPAEITAVRIYHDNGTGTMDYNTPIGSATLYDRGGMIRFEYTTSAYADDLVVTFAARSLATSVEDDNTDTVAATADALAPAAPTGLSATAVGETDGDG